MSGSINNVQKSWHNIVCPFCYKEYSPFEVRFMFREESGKPFYLSAYPESEETKKYAIDNNLLVIVTTDDTAKIPVRMSLRKKNQTTPFSSSPIRVCKNEECNKKLSPYAGTYSADNGLFVLGLKSSGKTVFITSVIDTLQNILAKKYK